MTINLITNEAKRGCGYRKPGGLYIVAGKPDATCGKLPLVLDVCPCCGAGFKPSRGWTWVRADTLFNAKACTHGNECEGRCPLSNLALHEETRMGMLWVGEKFYKTPADFLNEGMAQGISRRLHTIPREFVLGKTRVLFAHIHGVAYKCDECDGQGSIITAKKPEKELFKGEPEEVKITKCEKCEGTGTVRKPAIFGCFLPQRIEYIVKDDDTEEHLESLEKRGITLVRLVRTDDESEDDGQPTEQQEQADFAQDEYIDNIPGDEIL